RRRPRLRPVGVDELADRRCPVRAEGGYHPRQSRHRLEVRHPFQPLTGAVTATVTLVGDDGSSVAFSCPPGVTVDAAARSAGYRLRVVCARGGCGACRATLLDGEIDRCGPVSATKTDDRATGRHYDLLCRSTAETDTA